MSNTNIGKNIDELNTILGAITDATRVSGQIDAALTQALNAARTSNDELRDAARYSCWQMFEKDIPAINRKINVYPMVLYESRELFYNFKNQVDKMFNIVYGWKEFLKDPRTPEFVIKKQSDFSTFVTEFMKHADTLRAEVQTQLSMWQQLEQQRIAKNMLEAAVQPAATPVTPSVLKRLGNLALKFFKFFR